MLIGWFNDGRKEEKREDILKYVIVVYFLQMLICLKKRKEKADSARGFLGAFKESPSNGSIRIYIFLEGSP